MVHFPGLARTRLCIQRAVSELHSEGFPHSDISGSMPACGSPELFAACHVLHRLLAPRHPPHALGSLTIKLTQHVAPALASNCVSSRKKGGASGEKVRLSYKNPLRSIRANMRFCAHFCPSTRRVSMAHIASLFSCQRAMLPIYRKALLQAGPATQHWPQIKNPASSAGLNRSDVSERLCAKLD
jgi:hypothetical protein